MKPNEKLVSLFLAVFVVWDLILAAQAILFPETWFRFIHGVEYVDPQALLARTGAIWAAFSVFHLIALLRWKNEPWWLVVVAGMRLSEVFADWTYRFMAADVTTMGGLALLGATPANLLFSVLFIRAYLARVPDAGATR